MRSDACAATECNCHSLYERRIKNDLQGKTYFEENGRSEKTC